MVLDTMILPCEEITVLCNYHVMKVPFGVRTVLEESIGIRCNFTLRWNQHAMRLIAMKLPFEEITRDEVTMRLNYRRDQRAPQSTEFR